MATRQRASTSEDTRSTTEPVAPIAIVGFQTGRPQFESRADLTQSRKTGYYSQPGLYDEMVQQWPAVRKQEEQLRAEAANLVPSTRPCGYSADTPDGDE